MLSVNDLTVQFGKEPLFKNVNITFSQGNCYGLIGANGSGKSTFLKVLAGDIEPLRGEVVVPGGLRVSVLKQDHFAYDDYQVLTTVVMGHHRLYEIIREKDELYCKTPFTDEDGIKAAELEEEFGQLDGWTIEAEAAKLLNDLGIEQKYHMLNMDQIDAGMKVRVLLAQALVGEPDILLLDEPTNHLDVETCMWLEDFLADFKNTSIVVSHDRHFLDNVCTHIADIDFGQIQLYCGNYTFWSESSQLALRQRQDRNKKIEEKRAEMKEFIARFSANASKSRQATSRKKILEKLTVDQIKPSSRKYPYVEFKFDKEPGNDILTVKDLHKSVDGDVMYKHISFELSRKDRIAFLGRNDLAITSLFNDLAGVGKPDSGTLRWGQTVNVSYFPRDPASYFEKDITIIDWLRQFSEEKTESYLRSFLGKMLFSGADAFKSVRVLSGGEKVRCMLAKIMMSGANVLILDEPTNHLDLESITALNEGLKRFTGVLLINSHDHQILQTVANRVIEISSNGMLDKPGYLFDDYINSESIKVQREHLYLQAV